MPKALLVDDAGEPWLGHAVSTLRDGGCDPVTVVLGAAADEAAALLDGAGVAWSSRRTGPRGWGPPCGPGWPRWTPGPEAALVSLVDLPDVTADVVRRVLDAGVDPGALRRAAYDGRPRPPGPARARRTGPACWPSAAGDRGARDYLACPPSCSSSAATWPPGTTGTPPEPIGTSGPGGVGSSRYADEPSLPVVSSSTGERGLVCIP